MKFSTACSLANREGTFFVVRTGRKNVRVLECGHSREESFVVPIGQGLNRRPAGDIEQATDPDLDNLDNEVEIEEAEYLPQ